MKRMIRTIFVIVLSWSALYAFAAWGDEIASKSNRDSDATEGQTVITEEAVWDRLGELQDDMLGKPLSVLDMGLIYDVKVDGSDVHVTATLYHRGYVEIERLTSPVRQTILQMDAVGDVTVECVWGSALDARPSVAEGQRCAWLRGGRPGRGETSRQV